MSKAMTEETWKTHTLTLPHPKILSQTMNQPRQTTENL